MEKRQMEPVRSIPREDFLVSIVLHGYAGSMIEHCLQTIFRQRHITSFELVVCDDASADDAWEIANSYASTFPGKITLSRNNLSLGRKENKEKALQLCKGKYQIELTGDMAFDSAYAKHVIANLEEDKSFQHAYISRTKANTPFLPPRKPRGEVGSTTPLVSVCVYNFNYGRYLRQCLESIFSQTYQNIEICFSDNASTDDSWEIALEFAAKYPKRMSLTRNRVNFGTNVNLRNCMLNARGKYLLKLGADDAIEPEFISECVSKLELHSEAAFAMVHRHIMDEHGSITSEAPFYDRSCLIRGEEQAAVYMMAAVNASISQILYNAEKIHGKRMAGNLNERWHGDRLMDFHICCDSPIIYIRDPLLLNRIHPNSDTSAIDGNLLQCFSQYVLIHQFADIAGSYEFMDKARNRLGPALDKLGSLCMRYCVRLLTAGDEVGAKRYFYLSRAITPDIETDDIHRQVNRYWQADERERGEILSMLLAEPNLVTRSTSYPPPPGSVILENCAASDERRTATGYRMPEPATAA